MELRGHIDKDLEIIKRAKGRHVLHLGCVGFTDSSPAEKIALARQSLHQQLTNATECLGIDLDETSIRELQKNGIFTNVRAGDVERLDELADELGQFDLVVAGDIIEHLSNPGKMLDGIHSVLKRDGQLIVSTPNSMGLPAYVRYAFGRFREGQQHVLCFNPLNLEQLLNRHHYTVVEAFSCHQSRARSMHGPLFAVGLTFLNAFPRFGGTLFVVAQKSSHQST